MMWAPAPWFPAAALLAWAALDWAYPYHSSLLLRIHPVHTAYLMARHLHRPGASTAWGAFLAASVIATHVLPYAVAYYLLVNYGLVWAALVLAVWVLKVSASLRLLLKTVDDAASMLENGDIDGARSVVQGIVRRDTSSLPPHLVASAAIESLAESLVDGLTSPLTYYALLGPGGALLQRVVNTLDGAVGFLDEEHAAEGRVSAYLDTLMNYLPARYTALLIALAAALAGGDRRGALSCWRRYSGVTESSNAGHPMAAMAGALGVRLEKLGHYVIPCGDDPGPADVNRAVRIGYTAAIAHLVLVSVAATALGIALS